MNLICPRCMSEETIRLDLTDGDTMTCGGCDEEFTVDAVADLVASWSRVLPWLRCHPARQTDTQAAGARL